MAVHNRASHRGVLVTALTYPAPIGRYILTFSSERYDFAYDNMNSEEGLIPMCCGAGESLSQQINRWDTIRRGRKYTLQMHDNIMKGEVNFLRVRLSERERAVEYYFSTNLKILLCSDGIITIVLERQDLYIIL